MFLLFFAKGCQCVCLYVYVRIGGQIEWKKQLMFWTAQMAEGEWWHSVACKQQTEEDRMRKTEIKERKIDTVEDLRKLSTSKCIQYLRMFSCAYVCKCVCIRVCLTQLLKLSSHALGPWRERGTGCSLGWWWCCGWKAGRGWGVVAHCHPPVSYLKLPTLLVHLHLAWLGKTWHLLWPCHVIHTALWRKLLHVFCSLSHSHTHTNTNDTAQVTQLGPSCKSAS